MQTLSVHEVLKSAECPVDILTDVRFPLFSQNISLISNNLGRSYRNTAETLYL